MNNGLNTEYKERENGRKRREYLNSNAKTEYVISGRNTHTHRENRFRILNECQQKAS